MGLTIGLGIITAVLFAILIGLKRTLKEIEQEELTRTKN